LSDSRGYSDINRFRRRQGVVYLDAEISDRAFGRLIGSRPPVSAETVRLLVDWCELRQAFKSARSLIERQ
jgi:hypothetical protein